MRRSFISNSKRFLPLLTLIALIVAADLSPLGRLTPGQKTDKFQRAFRSEAPQVVLLGNSICLTAFEPDIIEEKLKALGVSKHVFRYGLNASGMGIWYLVLNNEIIKATTKPEWVVLSARSHNFLNNHYSFTPRHRRRYFPMYKRGELDQVLIEKAVDGEDSELTMGDLLDPISNLYYSRDAYSKYIRWRALRTTFAALNATADALHADDFRASIADVHEQMWEKGNLADHLRNRFNNPDNEAAYLEDDAPDLKAARFYERAKSIDEDTIEHSLLPDFIRCCQAAGIRCVIARHYPNPSLPKPVLAVESVAWKQIQSYVNKHYPEVVCIDLGVCEGIQPTDFFSGDHFKANAQALISEYVAGQLAATAFTEQAKTHAD